MELFIDETKKSNQRLHCVQIKLDDVVVVKDWAESVASVIFLARNKAPKEDIKKYVENNFFLWSYLYRTCDEIRPTYKFDVSCQETVPEAITAFLEGQNFEDVIRTAVTLGGDCDTLTCIAGSIAEAFYGVPDNLKEECRKRLTPEMLEVLDKLDEIRKRNNLLVL